MPARRLAFDNSHWLGLKVLSARSVTVLATPNSCMPDLKVLHWVSVDPWTIAAACVYCTLLPLGPASEDSKGKGKIIPTGSTRAQHRGLGTRCKIRHQWLFISCYTLIIIIGSLFNFQSVWSLYGSRSPFLAAFYGARELGECLKKKASLPSVSSVSDFWEVATQIPQYKP